MEAIEIQTEMNKNFEYSENKNDIQKNLIKSNEIICPECYENILLNIKDYKINLYNCKNNHKFNNILLTEFDGYLNLDISKIICHICKSNRSDLNNNEFLTCLNCQINLCPKCKINHDKKHKIVNYDIKNYLCKEHNLHYIKYCNQCKSNICMKCEKNHKNHNNIIYLGDMLINEEDISNEIEELNKYIHNLNEQIGNIIKILNDVKMNMKKYIDLSKYISNNYNSENINYQILQNLDEIKKNNDIIKNDINFISNETNICKKFNKVFEIYNKMNNKIDNNNIIKNTIKVQTINEIFLIPNIKKINLEKGNIKQRVDSIKICWQLNEKYKIENITKFSLLSKNYSQEKEDYIETDPQYLSCKPDKIDILNNDYKYDFFFISKKDNNPYLILTYRDYSYHSSYHYIHEVYLLNYNNNLSKKLVKTIEIYLEPGLRDDSIKYFFNSKNNNEYLIRDYRDENNTHFIIIYDINNNYNIKRKIEMPDKSYSKKFLLAFPPNKNENFIILTEAKRVEDNYDTNYYTKVYSFESGKFIKTFSNSNNIYIYDFSFWHNKKDNNDYIIEFTDHNTLINNLHNDLYYQLNSQNSCSGFIYTKNDIDYLCCNCGGGIQIWNLFTKKIFKKILDNSYGFIRLSVKWNDRYFISSKGNYMVIWDIKDETFVNLSLLANKNMEILCLNKINHPKYGESLISVSTVQDLNVKNSGSYHSINIWSLS